MNLKVGGLTVKGNLRKNLGFWRSIIAPNFILTTVEKGYKLPFGSLPLAVRLRINKSARLHADFVDQAVLELVNSDGFAGFLNSLLLLTLCHYLLSRVVSRFMPC